MSRSRSAFSRSQNELVLNHLKTHGQLTPLKASGLYGVMRLAARIHELRNKGHAIKSVVARDPNGHPFAIYWMRTWDEPTAHIKQAAA